jgi:hypothetical protein
MIESRYWKEDLIEYQKKLIPVKKPPRWSEKLQVNFEKDITVSFFMIRKLIECTKLSSKTTNYKAQIFRSPCVGVVNNRNFWNIDELYDLDKEEQSTKKVVFICNQLIHGGAMYAYREEGGSWGGIFTCSDFERQKYVYRIPLAEILEILIIATHDYPETIKMTYSQTKEDYNTETD